MIRTSVPRAVRTGVILLSLSLAAWAQARPEIFPVSEIKPGMKGVARTVFEGTKPEEMRLEVLGVLHNFNGPKSDLILIRLLGDKPNFTGIVAGMSGSPVYIDGKLVGALSYRIGTFSKEPIGGVTPIAEMLEIQEMDESKPPAVHMAATPSDDRSSTVSAGAKPDPADPVSFTQYLKPIAAPLVFSGFSEEALQRFGPQFSSAGVLPVMGAGSAMDTKQPEPIEPGSSVGMVLVRGDMDITATCTVTYIDPERLLACGHPVLQAGKVDIPMTKSNVMATLPSSYDSFKIAVATETVGAFRQDRHAAILGRFGAEAQMIPMDLSISGKNGRQFHVEVLNNPRLTPLALMVSVFNALQSLNLQGDEVSFNMRGNIAVKGYPDVKLQNMYAPGEGLPTAFAAAISLGDRFGRIFDNSVQQPEIQGIKLEFEPIAERRSARLENARTDVTEARPGDKITIEAVLRPYRGERFVRRMQVRIPASTPRGTLRILVSDGDTLDRSRRVNPLQARKLDLNATIAAINKERANNRLYVSLLENNPQAQVEDKVMPTLPLSVINVLDGLRNSQDIVVLGESAVDESSAKLEYVVSGSQVITITIR